MSKIIIVYFTGLLLFLLVDLLWLGLVAKNFYKRELNRVCPSRASDIPEVPGHSGGVGKWPVIALVYVLMSLGLVVFVLPRATNGLWGFFWGGLYGLILYSVYDLTNFLTLAGWSTKMVLVDVAWGVFLNGLVASLLVVITRLLK